jgi:TetR/AcrR family transcriptional regulator, cholesterol catabolism regulator
MAMPRKIKLKGTRVNEILEHAAILFAEKGYEATSINDIARNCGFQSENLYNYFRSKEEILYLVMKRIIKQSISIAIDTATKEGMSSRQKLHIFIKYCLSQVLTTQQRSYGLLYDAGLRPLSVAHYRKMVELRKEYESILRRIIRDGINNGEFVDMDDLIVAHSIFSAVLRTRLWFSPDGRLSVDEIADKLFKTFVFGLNNSNLAIKHVRSDEL